MGDEGEGDAERLITVVGMRRGGGWTEDVGEGMVW